MAVRFPPFEFDPAAAELRKHGTRVPLQDQPSRVLAALVELPGQVISREELIARLWSGGTNASTRSGAYQVWSWSAEGTQCVQITDESGRGVWARRAGRPTGDRSRSIR